MSNNEIQNNISEIILLYDKMINIIEHTYGCFDPLAFLNGNFQEGRDKILHLENSNSEQLIKIREVCQNFLLTLRLLHIRVWPEVSLLINVKDIYDGVNNFMNTISNQFQSMGLSDLQIRSPIEDCITTSLSLLREYYEEIESNELTTEDQRNRARSQLEQISRINSNSDIESTYLLKNWNFNLSTLSDEKEVKIFKKYPLKLFSTAENNEKIFKLELNPVVSEESYQKQLILLSSIKKNVLPLLDATISKQKITCIFKYVEGIMPLKESLGEYKKKSMNTVSKLAFKIAFAINYLHSRNIVHGNISLESVFYLVTSSVIEIYLWNFGLSNNNKADEKIIPPEIIQKTDLDSLYCFNDSLLTFQTDIYQYGLLLYQIAKDPKEDTELKKIKEKDYNYEENLKKYCSEGMINLIKDCLKTNPAERPTMSDIILRFHTQDISFVGADKKKMEDFINFERFKGLQRDTTNRIFNSIINEVDQFPECTTRTASGFCQFLDQLFNDRNNKNDRMIQYLQNLDKYCFFEQIIRFFNANEVENSSFSREKFVNNYIKIFQPELQDKVFGNKSIKKEFLNNGGAQVIADYMKEEKSRKLSLLLLDQIIDSFDDECEQYLFMIIPELINIKEIKYICQIVDLKSITNDCKIRILLPHINEISPLFKESEHSDHVSYLIRFYLQCCNETDLAGDISFINLIYSFQDVMKSGKTSLLCQLMRFESFLSSITNEDIEEAIKTIVSEEYNQEQKDCAFLLCIGLGNEFFETVSKFNQIIDITLNNPNQELASRFIARITMFSSPCDYILTKIEENDSEPPFDVFVKCENPWYLLSLSRITGFYAERVSKINKIRENLIQNLNQMKNIEGSLRILGVLSKEVDFWKDLEVAKNLISILHKNSLTPYEKTILLSIISNLLLIDETKTFFSNRDNYLDFLSEVENNGKESGLSLRILSRLIIPDELEITKEILIQRLTNIIRDQLQIGDKFGIEGSSRLIIAMLDHYNKTPENEKVINNFKNIDVSNLLRETSKKEQNSDISNRLIEALNKFEQKMSS